MKWIAAALALATLAGCGLPLANGPTAQPLSFVLDAVPAAAPALYSQSASGAEPESGTWELVWQFGGHAVTDEERLTFQADGTVAVNGQTDSQAKWGSGNTSFVGGCGFHASAPRIFGSCERYTLQIVASDRMQGNVTFLVNGKAMVVPVVGRWSPTKAPGGS